MFVQADTRFVWNRGALWVRVTIKAGTDLSNYTLVNRLFTVSPTGSATDLLQKLESRVGVRVRDVIDHLEHLRHSYKKVFQVEPAECQKCGFIFEMRKKLDTPSRCPRCKNERLSEPRYWVAE